MMQPRRRTVGILVFDEVEVLDFCGPFEAFSVARRPEAPEDEDRLFDVRIIAEEQRIIRCRNGLLVQPHHTIEDHPPLGIVVVPGGYGTRRERTNPRILDWIARQSAASELTTSVCTGAFLLATVGLLDGHSATTHWENIASLRKHYPAVTVLENARYVDDGNVVTAAGVSAGIDMSLHVIARLHGEETAAWTARYMEYDRFPLAAG